MKVLVLSPYPTEIIMTLGREGDQILSKLKSGWQTNISDAIDILGIENN